MQKGKIGGNPARVCVAQARFSDQTIAMPSDPKTASRLQRATRRLRESISSACDASASAALAACAADPAGLADCVLWEQQSHIQHLLEQQFGEVEPVSKPAIRCQRAIAAAARGFVSRNLAAEQRCLDRNHDAAGDRGAQCLGSVESSNRVAPLDARTGERESRAEATLRRALARHCSAEALAAIDACTSDPGQLGDCLACSHRRESMLLVQGQRGGTADRPTTHFIDWSSLGNPVLQESDRMMKNQSVVYDQGYFYVFTGQRFEPDFTGSRKQWLYRTSDFQAFEKLDPPNLGRFFGSTQSIDGTWHLTTNGGVGGGKFEIFHSTSTDLFDWVSLTSLTPGLMENSIIDGSLTKRDGYWFLTFKDRALQKPFVTRSQTALLDGTWMTPIRAFAGTDDPIFGFVEAGHFMTIDGVQRVVVTGRDLERVRCPPASHIIYTGAPEPWIYTIDQPTTDLATWSQWNRPTQLRVPFEDWNTFAHANTGHIADWRQHDGFFYLSYSGSSDGDSFELRGHGKLGLARSRDLVHWRVAGDLRD